MKKIMYYFIHLVLVIILFLTVFFNTYSKYLLFPSILKSAFLSLLVLLLPIIIYTLYNRAKESPFLKNKSTELFYFFDFQIGGTLFILTFAYIYLFLFSTYPSKGIIFHLGVLILAIISFFSPILFSKKMRIFWKEEIIKYKGKRLFVREK